MKKTLLHRGLAAILGAAAAAPASALDFNAAWFFGDSITDSGAYRSTIPAAGGSRFTTDPGQVWSENLAAHFGTQALANNPNNPANTYANGTNFAQGGAQVENPFGVGDISVTQAAVPITQQLAWAFPDGRRADPDALYAVWAGSNDVIFQFQRLALGASQDDVSQELLTSASTLTQLVQQLANRGARYILVPNLPDIGDTPASILLAIGAAGAFNANLDNAMAAAVGVLAQPATTPAQQAAVRQAAVSAAADRLGIPTSALQSVVDQVATGTRQLSAGFNQATATLLPGTRANVIPLDIHSLFKEALADPAALGFANVTGTACLTASALPCTEATLIAPGTDQTFLFADSVHPASRAHRIIADYAGSVIEAPALAAGLAQVPLASGRMHQQTLERQMQSARSDTRTGRWGLFADLGAGSESTDATHRTIDYDNDIRGLTLGAGYRASDTLFAGLALAISDSDVSFGGDRGGFDARAYYLSAFADYHSGIWFARAIGTLAPKLELDDVTRRLHLGSALRQERGDTSGDALALKLSLGADLLGRGGLRLGPLVGIDYQDLTIDGYREQGGRSTSMGFLGQSNDSLLLQAGLFADYTTATSRGPLSLHAAVTREEELKDDGREVQAYLKTLPQQIFSLYDVKGPGSAWSIDLGLSAALSRDVSLDLGYLWRSTDDSGDESYANLGIRVAL